MVGLGVALTAFGACALAWGTFVDPKNGIGGVVIGTLAVGVGAQIIWSYA